MASRSKLTLEGKTSSSLLSGKWRLRVVVRLQHKQETLPLDYSDQTHPAHNWHFPPWAKKKKRKEKKQQQKFVCSDCVTTQRTCQLTKCKRIIKYIKRDADTGWRSAQQCVVVKCKHMPAAVGVHLSLSFLPFKKRVCHRLSVHPGCRGIFFLHLQKTLRWVPSEMKTRPGTCLNAALCCFFYFIFFHCWSMSRACCVVQCFSLFFYCWRLIYHESVCIHWSVFSPFSLPFKETLPFTPSHEPLGSRRPNHCWGVPGVCRRWRWKIQTVRGGAENPAGEGIHKPWNESQWHWTLSRQSKSLNVCFKK